MYSPPTTPTLVPPDWGPIRRWGLQGAIKMGQGSHLPVPQPRQSLQQPPLAERGQTEMRVPLSYGHREASLKSGPSYCMKSEFVITIGVAPLSP